MINQISHVQNKTGSLPSINKGLIQARHIQARVKEHYRAANSASAWSPFTAGPYLVPVTRWVE